MLVEFPSIFDKTCLNNANFVYAKNFQILEQVSSESKKLIAVDFTELRLTFT